MRAAIRAFMASSLAMLAASGTPVNVYDRMHSLQMYDPATRYRSRFPGKARPAGSKLARKAARGRLGVSTIR